MKSVVCTAVLAACFAAVPMLAMAAEPTPAAAPIATPVSAAQPAAAAATPSSPAAPGAVRAPPAGKGQVVFYRRSSLMGFPYWTNVRENGAAYGKLTNGVYFVTTLDPGVHSFETSVLGKDTLKLQIDPGETYYVEGKITMQLIGYTITMLPSDEGKFQKVAGGIKLVALETADPAAK